VEAVVLAEAVEEQVQWVEQVAEGDVKTVLLVQGALVVAVVVVVVVVVADAVAAAAVVVAVVEEELVPWAEPSEQSLVTA
jgi:hypothetical protein